MTQSKFRFHRIEMQLGFVILLYKMRLNVISSGFFFVKGLISKHSYIHTCSLNPWHNGWANWNHLHKKQCAFYFIEKERERGGGREKTNINKFRLYESKSNRRFYTKSIVFNAKTYSHTHKSNGIEMQKERKKEKESLFIEFIWICT